MASAENSLAMGLPRPEMASENQNDDLSLGKESHLSPEDSGRPWDPTDEGAEADDDATAESPLFTRAVRVVKVLVYLCTFCIVLGCGVVSKATLLLMTTLIDRDRTFSVCDRETGLEKDSKFFLTVSEEERWSWTWCLLFVLFVPELLTLLRCTRLCVFKQWQKPKISSFLTVLLMESLHVVGMALMTFSVFPKLHVIDALCLTNAVCTIPSLINLCSNWNTHLTLRSTATNTLHLSAFIGQLSAFVWFGLNATSDQSHLELYIQGAIGVLLLSCLWWENYIDKNSSTILVEMKKDIEKSRPFIYVFISLWKMVLLFGLCLAAMFHHGEDVESFLYLPNSFMNHTVVVVQPGVRYPNLSELVTAVDTVVLGLQRPSVYLPVIVAGIHVAATYLCYSCGKFVCKICIQDFSYALPVCLTVPVAVSLLGQACEMKCAEQCAFASVVPFLFWRCPSESVSFLFVDDLGLVWVPWLLSQMWVTVHIWSPKCERMASTNKLFVNPMYCTLLIDQTLALNRRKDKKVVEEQQDKPPAKASTETDKADVPQIFACATMWHETLDEMEQLLKSIMRMDAHQCSQKAIRDQLFVRNPDYYEMEAHIFFDDAFVVSDEDDEKMTINSFVKEFIEAVNIAARKVYQNCKEPDPPIIVPTPYGGRLIWRLLGDNPLVVHLKNKELIRHKKRWSQVMYMYYLLGYRLVRKSDNPTSLSNLLKNTFVLALDGDIDFRPKSVTLLVDLMNRNKSLGAACGRIHPVGSGLMVYYQKFEYAIGHWLQKSTEHMIGCVLCSPGCFSLFRAEALVRNNTIRTYASKSKEAIEYVQFDQGEDRWLCTLLLQRGYRVEYSAASDAYTHCPETFGEFYTQRRRWAPSTLANIMDLIVNYRKTVACNDNISRPYIGYQVLLMIGTILGPGTIFLMLVGAMVSAFGISNWQSFLANLIPIVFFILICFHSKNNTQILVAQIFSALYALLMMAVMVGISLQLAIDGITSPSAIFIISMTASFIIAALAHPQEFWCVAHGLIYFLSVPSMYLLLALYSFINLHVVSWGTREVQAKKTKQQLAAEQIQAQVVVMQQKKKSGWMDFLGEHGLQLAEEEGSVSFGLANLFRCMCCTYPRPDPASLHMAKIEAHLKEMNSQVQRVQRQLEAPVNRVPGFRRRSIHLLKDQNLDPLPEDGDTIEENECISEEQQSEGIEEHTYNQPDSQEFWLTDKALQKSTVKRLNNEETSFWTDLIETYLYPLPDDPEEKAKISKQLLDLRNTVVFGILMLNSLFILVVFLLQMQKDTLHVEWPLSSRGKANITYIENLKEIRIEMEYLQLEPINLVLVFFFTLILVIQFIAMLFHRLETLSHILASTAIFESRSEESKEIDFSRLTDLLQKQGLKDDDDEDELVDGLGPGRAFDGLVPDCPQQQPQSSVEQSVRQSTRGFASSSCSVSLGGDRLLSRRKPKFRSLSIALEQNLQKMLQNDPKFAKKARRNSRHPHALDQLIRSPRGSVGTTTPSRCGTVQNDLEMLDRAFGTPLSVHRSFGPASEQDTESVDSIEMKDLRSAPSSFRRQTEVKRPLERKTAEFQI